MASRAVLTVVLVTGFLAAPGVRAADRFQDVVVPFLQKHCQKCHRGASAEGGVAFERYARSSHIQTDFEFWEKVLRAIEERQMPPEDEPRPAEAALRDVLRGLQEELAKFDCSQIRKPGRVTIRRLNRVEYNNTIRDLTGIDFRPADDFPSDDVGNGFDNIADVLTLPPLLLEKYLDAAGTIADKVLADPQARQRLLPHRAEGDVSQLEAARRNIRQFGERAFRRPLRDDELERLLQLARAALDAGGEPQEAIKLVVQATLVSPHFLFRIEADPTADDEDGIRRLNDFELATRLSYFLWSTMPDQPLLDAARAGKLRSAEQIYAQVDRMLDDPKADALVQNFAGQWLQLRSLGEMTPDPKRFPDFDEPLRQAMRRETELFFNAVLRENRSVLEFLAADFSYVNERLARHYGLPDVTGDAFRRVSLDGRRRGVLTHASILLVTSNPTRTSPVKRGKWILDNILGEPPPLPPAGVEPLDENAETLGSLRTRMEQHRSNESCAVCHRKMDTLGLGLENFDAVGAWRERDGRFDIDPSGVLPGGRKFDTASELMRILVEDKKREFCRCLTEKMLTYALGRGLQSFDRCAVDEILTSLEADEFRFRTLIKAIATSSPFTYRESQGDR